ncbi:MAG: 1-acyl-sn-glycerol-3-phosphate acyltransferase [Gammaproteobacteria bacterium]|nr:1-acyl-sn-glycerol-3-phosphate acyltransferase [Gammaproteobacteria bacterium]
MLSRWFSNLFILLHILVHIFRCIGMLLRHRIIGGPQWHYGEKGKEAIRRWMDRMRQILNVDIEIDGQPSRQTVLLVANHLSWLDIIVLSSVYPYVFLAKHEIKRWPIVGFMSSISGTLFIRRASVRSLKQSVDDIRDTLAQGRSVAIFPEGTTTRGNELLPFKNGLFDAAISSSVAIQPVAIQYVRRGKQDKAATYAEDDHFLVSIFKQIREGALTTRLTFLDEIPAAENRRSLAEQSQERIARFLFPTR